MVNEDLVRAFEEKFRDNMIHHYINFPAFSSNFMVTFHQIVSGKVKFRKLCAEVAYGRTQIGTAGHDIGLSDTIQ